MKSLKILKVYTGQLKSLPENIGTKHPSLEMIFVAGTKLNSIPPSIGKLANLKHIRMFSNEIKTLPDELGDAKNLESIFLDHNKIKKLPQSLSKLKDLLQLSVTNNMLTHLPSEIGNLKKLYHLTVQNNNVKTLPKSFFELESLYKFYAYNNKITSVDGISNLKLLRKVDLRNNMISSLPTPEQMKTMHHSIKTFYISKNPVCNNASSIPFPSNFDRAKGKCEKQCGPDCRDSSVGNTFCDDGHYIYFWAKLYDNVKNVNIKPVRDSGCYTKSCNYDEKNGVNDCEVSSVKYTSYDTKNDCDGYYDSLMLYDNTCHENRVNSSYSFYYKGAPAPCKAGSKLTGKKYVREGCKGTGSDMKPKIISKVGTKCFETGNDGSAKVECAAYTSLGYKQDANRAFSFIVVSLMILFITSFRL